MVGDAARLNSRFDSSLSWRRRFPAPSPGFRQPRVHLGPVRPFRDDGDGLVRLMSDQDRATLFETSGPLPQSGGNAPVFGRSGAPFHPHGFAGCGKGPIEVGKAFSERGGGDAGR
ncbi:hypothetical protein Nans01_33640 [Nocardiopsis ansamitocini]|uniref:Uncharacterized protein n=1 Tax=Nocardiopsis ansamitocini TaxID=1670832 RepID=A0A9W6P8N5_9ACTN|nr:hypothetical protein Nans01_33640 [Nocardiopsis ansamitocini]